MGRRCLGLVAFGAVALVGVGCGSAAPAPDGGGRTPSASAAVRPTIGAWHHLVYDARLGAVVLVNGAPERGLPADAPLELWSWDGRAWRRLDPGGGEVPRWRNFAAVAYDTDRSVLIVHGGLQGEGRPLDETWEWDGQRWRRFPADGPTTGPGGREGSVGEWGQEPGVRLGGRVTGVGSVREWDREVRLGGRTTEWDG